jgi:hypothetical protein
MHTFSHLNRRTYLIVQIGILMLAISLWLILFVPVAV